MKSICFIALTLLTGQKISLSTSKINYVSSYEDMKAVVTKESFDLIPTGKFITQVCPTYREECLEVKETLSAVTRKINSCH